MPPVFDGPCFFFLLGRSKSYQIRPSKIWNCCWGETTVTVDAFLCWSEFYADHVMAQGQVNCFSYFICLHFIFICLHFISCISLCLPCTRAWLRKHFSFLHQLFMCFNLLQFQSLCTDYVHFDSIAQVHICAVRPLLPSVTCPGYRIPPSIPASKIQGSALPSLAPSTEETS